MVESASSLTDHQLLHDTARRDEGAFGELYRRYCASLYTYLLRLVHESGVAEDLLQETFVAVWDGAGRFRGQAKVSTWLFRIAHHKAIDWLRRQRLDPAGEIERVAADDCPEEEALSALQADRLRSALASLSPDHRAVLELVFFQRLSYREVARVVGCPVGTVKSRVSCAKRCLGALLRLARIEPDV